MDNRGESLMINGINGIDGIDGINGINGIDGELLNFVTNYPLIMYIYIYI